MRSVKRLRKKGNRRELSKKKQREEELKRKQEEKARKKPEKEKYKSGKRKRSAASSQSQNDLPVAKHLPPEPVVGSSETSNSEVRRSKKVFQVLMMKLTLTGAVFVLECIRMTWVQA